MKKKKNRFFLSLLSFTVLLTIIACSKSPETKIPEPPKLRSNIGENFDYRSNEVGPDDITAARISSKNIAINEGPAVAHNGTLYLGTTNGLLAINPNDLSEKWHYEEGENVIAPAITPESYIISAGPEGVLEALKDNGNDYKVIADYDNFAGSITQVQTDSTGNIVAISNGTKLHNLLIKDTSFKEAFDTVTLKAKIIKPIIIHNQQIILASKQTVFFYDLNSGEYKKEVTGINSSYTFILNKKDNSIIVGDDTEIKKISIQTGQISTIYTRSSEKESLGGANVDSNGSIYIPFAHSGAFGDKINAGYRKFSNNNKNTEFIATALDKKPGHSSLALDSENKVYLLIKTDKEDEEYILYSMGNSTSTEKSSVKIKKAASDDDSGKTRFLITSKAIFLSNFKSKTIENDKLIKLSIE